MALRVLSLSSVASDTSAPPSPTPPTHVQRYHVSLRTLLLFVLPGLSVLGAYLTFTLSSCNGTFDWLISIVTKDDPKFPGTSYTLTTSFTRISAVDRQLAILVAFFAPIVDSKFLPTTLFSIAGFGQFGAAWALMMMESMRTGNKGKLVSYITIVGILIQNISYTITTPIWLFLHLLTSPVAQPQGRNNASNSLLIPTLDLKVLPLSIAIGYILPSVMMTLPAPSVTSPANHQRWIAIWQAFPIWCVLAQRVLRVISQYITANSNQQNNHPQLLIGTTYLSNVQPVYRFLLTICTITHLPVLVLTLLPSSMIPTSYSTLHHLTSSTLSLTYIPYLPPSTAYKVSSLVQGVHTFLTWDLYIGSLALLLWAIALWRTTDLGRKLPMYRQGGKEVGGSWRRLAGMVVKWGLLSGPLGVVTVLLWERDEVVRVKVKAGV